MEAVAVCKMGAGLGDGENDVVFVIVVASKWVSLIRGW